MTTDNIEPFTRESTAAPDTLDFELSASVNSEVPPQQWLNAIGEC